MEEGRGDEAIEGVDGFVRERPSGMFLVRVESRNFVPRPDVCPLALAALLELEGVEDYINRATCATSPYLHVSSIKSFPWNLP